MGTDDINSNTTNDQSVKERWEIVHSLSTGATITINDEYTELTVSNIRPNANGGSTKQITLLSNANEQYVLHVPNDSPEQLIFTLPNNEEVQITSITPAKGAMIATTTARDIYGAEITDVNIDATDTYPEERNSVPEIEPDEFTIIGECPSCGCVVAEQNNKATCTGCEAWAPIDEWNVYHKYESRPDSTGYQQHGEKMSQTSLADSWD